MLYDPGMTHPAPAAERARPPKTPAVVTAYRSSTTPQWRYEPRAKVSTPFPLRATPDAHGYKTGAQLQPGEIFSVSFQQRSRDGILFLKLADGRGWAFDKLPSFSPVIVPHREDTFDLDEACEDLLDLWDDLEDDSHLSGEGVSGRVSSAGGMGWTMARTPSRRQPQGLLGMFVGCLSCATCEAQDRFNAEPEGPSQLLVEKEVVPMPGQMLGTKDMLDITFTPRSDRLLAQTFTPRQLDFVRHLQLPEMHTLPVPPNCSPDEPEEVLRLKLFEMYQDFASELYAGIYLTQLMSNAEHTDIHCQLIDDMTTLRLDQSSGFLYEFPLTDVSRVFPVEVPRTNDHVVFIQFFKRKIAFVFKDKEAGLRFTMCMDLFILRAQQKRLKEAQAMGIQGRAPLYGWPLREGLPRDGRPGERLGQTLDTELLATGSRTGSQTGSRAASEEAAQLPDYRIFGIPGELERAASSETSPRESSSWDGGRGTYAV